MILPFNWLQKISGFLGDLNTGEMMLPFNGLNISSTDLVLEVGSGHRPCYRADVLCDKYLTDEERADALKKDRPIFLSDCHNLPFKDKVFDYIICSQILEHVQDPARCCEEISRVGKKGYIETPSMLWEKLHPTRDYHRWFILLIDSTLIFFSKDKSELNSVFGALFEIMYSNSLEYHLFFRSYRKLFEVRYEWHGRINYLVNPGDDFFRSFFVKPWGIEEYNRFYPKRAFNRQILELAMNLVSVTLLLTLRKPRILIGNILKEYRKRRLKINMESLLACPKCRGDVEVLFDHIKCLKCNAVFLYRHGIPDMVPENYDTNNIS